MPTIDEVKSGFTNLAKAGVKIMITEMDITVLPKKGSGNILNPYPDKLPDDMQEKLAKRYSELFTAFRNESYKIERVNLWGVHDGQSWLNDWPIKGRTNYPLLFDRQLQPKPAFFAVIKSADGNEMTSNQGL
jgi:endo-1,4-beta-xylanase